MRIRARNNRNKLVLSFNALISGSHQLSTAYIKTKMAVIANNALMSPLMIALESNGGKHGKFDGIVYQYNHNQCQYTCQSK